MLPSRLRAELNASARFAHVAGMPMISDRLQLKRLHSLDFWREPITVERLNGGLTNDNFRVRAGRRSYVARLCIERPSLGIDRRNEVACQRAAHAVGIAPEIVHHEDGVLVSAHLDAVTLTSELVRDLAFLRRLAEVLRKLHDSWDTLTGEIVYFSAFQTVRTYAETAKALGAELPSDIESLLEDARRLSRKLAPFVPALCHNDLLAANILDDGHKVWLVDWEYAGIGHPLFDLAGVSGNCALTEPLEIAFLEAYRGYVDPRELAELRLLKTMSLLREALWAVIQTVDSDIDFDYVKYAEDNFEAYREARALLRV